MKRTKPERVKATLYNGKTLQRFWKDAMARPVPRLISRECYNCHQIKVVSDNDRCQDCETNSGKSIHGECVICHTRAVLMVATIHGERVWACEACRVPVVGHFLRLAPQAHALVVPAAAMRPSVRAKTKRPRNG